MNLLTKSLPPWPRTADSVYLAIRRPLALCLLLSAAMAAALPKVSQAAPVDLVVSIQAPVGAASRETFRPLAFPIEFGNNIGTATAATATIHLPAHVRDVQVDVPTAPANAPGCPLPGSFNAPTAPISAPTDIRATISSLNTTEKCRYTLTITPILGGVEYKPAISMDTSPADTEEIPGTNRSDNPVSITAASLDLEIKKVITNTGGMTGTGVDIANRAMFDSYTTPVRFEITYANRSDVPLPLKDSGSVWFDWESRETAQIIPPGARASGMSCSSSLDPDSKICGAIEWADAGTMAMPGEIDIYRFDFDKIPDLVMEPDETITIVYERTYTQVKCGRTEFFNTSVWAIDESRVKAILDPVSDDRSRDRPAVRYGFVEQASTDNGSCIELDLAWTVDKRLMGIRRDGNLLASSTAVTQDGDVAVYEVEIHIDPNDPKNKAIFDDPLIPGPVKSVPFRIYDHFNPTNWIRPTASPVDAVRVGMDWIGCVRDGTPQARADCIKDDEGGSTPVNPVIQASQAKFDPAGSAYVRVGIGEKLVLQTEVTINFVPTTPICLNSRDTFTNHAQFYILAPAVVGYHYTDAATKFDESDPFSLLPDLAYCVNLTANVDVSPTTVPDGASPVTISLTFTNSTSAEGASSVAKAIGTSALGSNFQPTTPPTCVSTGATYTELLEPTISTSTFTIEMNNMPTDAIVSCTVTGTMALPGSYEATASISLAPPGDAVAADKVTLIKAADALPGDNTAKVNYKALGAQVSITNVTDTLSAVVPGTTVTHTVTVASTGSSHTNGTQVGYAPNLEDLTWTCRAQGAAVCPTPDGSGPISHTVATFPEGDELIYTVTGKIPATATAGGKAYTATATLPAVAFISCGPGSTPGPCQAAVAQTVTLPTPVGPGPGPVPGGGSPGGPGTVAAIPTLGTLGLCAMGSMLLLLARNTLRTRTGFQRTRRAMTTSATKA